MKAWVNDSYGGPEVMQLRDVPKPTPGRDAVLVKVHAVSVNPADWHVLRGKPLFARLQLGLFAPKHRILGCDVAGTVEALGPGVTGYAVGDAIFGNLLDDGFGCFAEYVVVPVKVLAPKPPKISPRQRRFRRRRPFRGADRKGLGRRGDGRHQHAERRFRPSPRRRPRHRLPHDRLHPHRQALRPHPRRRRQPLRPRHAPRPRPIRRLRRHGLHLCRKLAAFGLRGGKRMQPVNAHASAANLRELGAMAEAGKLRPMIERRFGFAEVPEAIRVLETLRVRGKVTITAPA